MLDGLDLDLRGGERRVGFASKAELVDALVKRLENTPGTVLTQPISSTTLTLFLLPLLYSALESRRVRRAAAT